MGTVTETTKIIHDIAAEIEAANKTKQSEAEISKQLQAQKKLNTILKALSLALPHRPPS